MAPNTREAADDETLRTEALVIIVGRVLTRLAAVKGRSGSPMELLGRTDDRFSAAAPSGNHIVLSIETDHIAQGPMAAQGIPL